MYNQGLSNPTPPTSGNYPSNTSLPITSAPWAGGIAPLLVYQNPI